MRTRKGVVALVALAVVGAAAPTAAAEPAAGQQHCVMHLSKVGKSTDTCYDTFTEAIADATNGKITDAPASADSVAGDAGFAARLNAAGAKKGSPQANAAAGGTVIGIEWIHSLWKGSSWTAEADYGCDNNWNQLDWLQDNLGGTWLNDEISSFDTRFSGTYGDCIAVHYEHAYFYGASDKPEVYLLGMDRDEGRHCGTPLGMMNDRTSSITWGGRVVLSNPPCGG